MLPSKHLLHRRIVRIVVVKLDHFRHQSTQIRREEYLLSGEIRLGSIHLSMAEAVIMLATQGRNGVDLAAFERLLVALRFFL